MLRVVLVIGVSAALALLVLLAIRYLLLVPLLGLKFLTAPWKFEERRRRREQ